MHITHQKSMLFCFVWLTEFTSFKNKYRPFGGHYHLQDIQRWNVQGARDRITISKMSTTVATASKSKEENSYSDRPCCWLCHSFAIVVLKSWPLEGYCHHSMTKSTRLKKKAQIVMQDIHIHSYHTHVCWIRQLVKWNCVVSSWHHAKYYT